MSSDANCTSLAGVVPESFRSKANAIERSSVKIGASGGKKSGFAGLWRDVLVLALHVYIYSQGSGTRSSG